MPPLSKLGLFPNLAIIASPVRLIMIQVTTTTASLWSLLVIMPCGGKDLPLPWKAGSGGNTVLDMEKWRLERLIQNLAMAKLSYAQQEAGNIERIPEARSFFKNDWKESCAKAR